MAKRAPRKPGGEAKGKAKKAAATEFVGELKADGVLIYDEDLFNPGEIRKGIKAYPIKAQRTAETDLGRKIVTNNVIRAFFTALTQTVPKEAMVKAIKTSVPKGTIDLN